MDETQLQAAERLANKLPYGQRDSLETLSHFAILALVAEVRRLQEANSFEVSSDQWERIVIERDNELAEADAQLVHTLEVLADWHRRAEAAEAEVESWKAVCRAKTGVIQEVEAQRDEAQAKIGQQWLENQLAQRKLVQKWNACDDEREAAEAEVARFRELAISERIRADNAEAQRDAWRQMALKWAPISGIDPEFDRLVAEQKES